MQASHANAAFETRPEKTAAPQAERKSCLRIKDKPARPGNRISVQLMPYSPLVMPAHAGIQAGRWGRWTWIPLSRE